MGRRFASTAWPATADGKPIVYSYLPSLNEPGIANHENGDLARVDEGREGGWGEREAVGGGNKKDLFKSLRSHA